jgi:drug/metabolite transporter (DMT)-like permease
LDADARLIAEGAERNVWQADGLIDRLVLVVLLASVSLALAAGFLRAANRRFEPPLTPSGLAAAAAALGSLLVVYRMIQEPGFDDATTVEAGVPFAIVVLGVLGFACGRALRAEQTGAAFRELPPAPGERGEEAPASAAEK